MIEIRDLFGKGSGQTERYLIINKAELNITPSSTNTAESLFAAIVEKASKQYLGNLTDENNNTITDPEGNKITFDNRVPFESTQLKYYERYLPPGAIRDVFELLIFTHD
ncbi:MAG: hypothetical protein AAF349_26725 [Cyanobacteria bacterium P01_A01_bin.68]